MICEAYDGVRGEDLERRARTRSHSDHVRSVRQATACILDDRATRLSAGANSCGARGHYDRFYHATDHKA